VVRRIKDRVEQKFGVAVAEVGSLDVWQRAELGLALAGSERAYVEEILGRIVGFVRELGVAELIDDRRDVLVYNHDPVSWTDATLAGAERTGAGDKAGADQDWIPEEWRKS
jgi:uncharacterized protein YlxP (DUF503 family)